MVDVIYPFLKGVNMSRILITPKRRSKKQNFISCFVSLLKKSSYIRINVSNDILEKHNFNKDYKFIQVDWDKDKRTMYLRPLKEGNGFSFFDSKNKNYKSFSFKWIENVVKSVPSFDCKYEFKNGEFCVEIPDFSPYIGS